MRFLIIALLMCLTLSTTAQIERPYYTVKETYKVNLVTDAYELASLRTTRGGTDIFIGEAVITETRLDVQGRPSKVTYYTIIDIETKEDRISYKVMKGNKIYFMEIHTGVLNEVLWKTPEETIFIQTGDVTVTLE